MIDTENYPIGVNLYKMGLLSLLSQTYTLQEWISEISYFLQTDLP